MGMGNVKVIGVNEDVTVAGRRPRRNSCIGGLINEYAGSMFVQEVESSNRLEKQGISGREKHDNLLMIPSGRITFISKSSQREKVVVQARYMRYILKQQRYIPRTKLKGKG